MLRPPCPSDYPGGPQDEPICGEDFDYIVDEIDGHSVEVFYDIADGMLSSVRIAGLFFEPQTFSYREVERLQQAINAQRAKEAA